MSQYPSRQYLSYLALIGTGGFFGAIARYLISTSAAPLVSTLIVNITGSFLLGLLMYANEYTGMFSPKTRYFAATGFLGSFTTFSTFAVPVSYTHLRAHETRHDLVCRLLLEKKKKKKNQ